MQLGTRLRYGMLAMLELARKAGAAPVRAADIAKAEGISKGYLEGLLAALRRTGLVRAVRGPGGGWVLARPASRIKAIDVYAALEGPTSLAPCVEDVALCPTGSKRCRARRLWASVTRALERALRAQTIAALAGVSPRARKKKPATATATVKGRKPRRAKAKSRAKKKSAEKRTSADRRKAAVVRNREIVKVVGRARSAKGRRPTGRTTGLRRTA